MTSENGTLHITLEHLNRSIVLAKQARADYDATQSCVLALAGIDILPKEYVVEASRAGLTAYEGQPHQDALRARIRRTVVPSRLQDVIKLTRLTSAWDMGEYGKVRAALPLAIPVVITTHTYA